MPVLSQCRSRVPGWKRPGLAPALVPSGIGCCVQGLTGHPAPSPVLLGFWETDGLQRWGGGAWAAPVSSVRSRASRGVFLASLSHLMDKSGAVGAFLRQHTALKTRVMGR